ncbi:hypothetical protein EIP86_006078 [Pleurotus ostreatoroseus]|nr:hypothetical protein EIP86_006078 [Pleurotus ostreatoroseus]
MPSFYSDTQIISSTNITGTLTSTQQDQFPAIASATTATSTFKIIASPSESATATTKSGSHKRVYAIAGALGGCLILISAVAILVWRRKRRSTWGRLGPGGMLRDPKPTGRVVNVTFPPTSARSNEVALAEDTVKGMVHQEWRQPSDDDNGTDDSPSSDRNSSDLDSLSILNRHSKRPNDGHSLSDPNTARPNSFIHAPTSDSAAWQAPPSTQSSPPSYSSIRLARQSLSLRRLDTSTSSGVESFGTLPQYETSG